MPGSSELWFATSNNHKFKEARFALRGFDVVVRRLPTKGQEMQHDEVAEIAKHSAREAFERFRRPLFVEDTGLFVPSLNGFPGPYAAYVNRTLGPESLPRLLRGASRRDAEFVSAVAYTCESPRVKLFMGRLGGEIAPRPRGSNGFGFDPVFVPEGSALTLAEMSLEEKSAISHRSKAIKALGAWVTGHRGRK
jgi:XTP/dITP diphosphohydrolase